MSEQDQGVAFGPGCQPSASAPSGSSQSGIPNARDFVVYNTGSGFRPYAAGRVTKTTAKLVYLATGTYNARRIHADTVVAVFADQVAADHLVQALDGAFGTFKERRWKADAERAKRVSQAHETFGKTAARLIAQAIEAQRAATAKTGAVEDESAVPEGCARD